MTPDHDAELGELLRRELLAEAGSVVPGADGLERIHSRIASRRARSALLRWWSTAVDMLRLPDGRLLRPSVAAIGAAIIVLAALASVPSVRQRVAQFAIPGVASHAPQRGGHGGGPAGDGGRPAGGPAGPVTRTPEPQSSAQGRVAPVLAPASCSPHPAPSSPPPATSASTGSASRSTPGRTQQATPKPGTGSEAGSPTQCPAGSPPPAHAPVSPPSTAPAPVPAQGTSGGATGGSNAGGAGQGTTSKGTTSKGTTSSGSASTGQASTGQSTARGTNPGQPSGTPSLTTPLLPGGTGLTAPPFT